jgi:hypothetical protein
VQVTPYKISEFKRSSLSNILSLNNRKDIHRELRSWAVGIQKWVLLCPDVGQLQELAEKFNELVKNVSLGNICMRTPLLSLNSAHFVSDQSTSGVQKTTHC